MSAIRTRSVWSNRFNMNQEDRRAMTLKPVPSESKSAVHALELMGSAVPLIEKSPDSLKYNMPIGHDDFMEVDTGLFPLYRKPGWEIDPRLQHIGLVGENYTVIDPLSMGKAWDAVIGKTPSNIQFQNDGTSMFMEVKVGEFEMKPVGERKRGDLLESYFWLNNPTNGGGSVTGGLREVRLVCTNGLIRETVGVENFKIKHENGTFDFMCEWMAFIWNKCANTDLTETCNAYNRLTEAKATLETVKWIMTELYPLPSAPKAEQWDTPQKVSFLDAMQSFEREYKKQAQRHEAILGLWNGGGTEIHSESAWDVLNVFTEFADYSKGTVDTMFAEAVVGDRAKTKQKAWKMLQSHLESPVL